MKKKLTTLIGLSLSLLALAACTPKTEEQKSTADKTSQSTQKEVAKPTTFVSDTGSFSIDVTGDWQEQVTASKLLGQFYDRIMLASTSVGGEYLDANRINKADLNLSLQQFSGWVMEQSFTKDSTIQEHKNDFKETSLGDKKGLLLQLPLEESLLSVFVYEDGNYYKSIALDTSDTQKKAAQDTLKTILQSWKDIPVSRNVELSQSISLPNSNLSLKLPGDWKQNSNLSKPDEQTLVYQSPDQLISVSLHTETLEEGMVWDIPGTLANVTENYGSTSTQQEVTFGGYSGYLIQARETNDQSFNIVWNHYLLVQDNKIFDIVFLTLASEADLFKPNMEAIIASLQAS